MDIYLANSLINKKEKFEPIEPGKVKMYSCGPTVYNYAHIGNMRAFLFADFLQRVLKTVGGYEVVWAMNLTNIDDKTIRDSAPDSSAWLSEMGEQTDDPKENLAKLTKFYEKAFFDDITTLGIDLDDFYALPRATDYIEPMKDLIRSIVEAGFGYVSEGSVYFDVAAWREKETYGRLFKIDFENFRAGVRVDSDQYERDQANDFALWKAKKEGEPYWEFEIAGESCPGRPGWHIECSAMEKELLGLPFDIHTGGIDLKFPHHEDEIAQSHAGYGIDPTKFWCHNEFLEVEGKKMSKSLGNFFTLRDLLEKGLDAIDIRTAMLSAHYSSRFNFTFEGVSAARKARLRIQDYIYDLIDEESGNQTADAGKLERDVFAKLADDLHSPGALGETFSFVNKLDPKKLNPESKKEVLEFFKKLNSVFAAWKFEKRPEVTIEIPEEISKMAEERFEAKKNKDWGKADELRDKIQAAGFAVKDKKDGYEITKI